MLGMTDNLKKRKLFSYVDYKFYNKLTSCAKNLQESDMKISIEFVKH